MAMYRRAVRRSPVLRSPMWLAGSAGRLFWVTTAVVALLWISVFFVHRSVGALAPIRTGSSPACLATLEAEAESPVSRTVGVNLDDTELAEPALSRALDSLDTHGVRWVRFTLPWDRLEPARGSFDWSWSDAVFAALARRPNMRPLVVLDRSPEWARVEADAGNPLAPPHERADFGAFAAAVAERYGSQVSAYQVWNEPNIAPHWGARPADPLDYLGLLREAAVQIRDADPDARIVLAGLAPTVEGGGANLSDLSYLDALYRLDARPWFDIAAAQPYGFSQPASAPAGEDSLNFGRAFLLRDVMTRHGDACTPLWVTSFGWNSLPPGAAGAVSPWGQVSEVEQANDAGAAMQIAKARGSWFGPLFWAAFCPDRPEDDPWSGFALCSAESEPSTGAFLPRPAWTALLEAAAAPSALAPGDHPMDDPALRYNGDWRVTASAADPGADGDSLTFDFYGSDLALRIQGGPYWALYRVWVDGAPANALPRDESDAAYLVLHDPLAERRMVTVAGGLSQGRHQARLEATGGWGQWALQGVWVGSTVAAARWPGWLLAGLAVLAVLGTLFWLGLLWMRRRTPPGAGAAGAEPAPTAAGELPEWLERVLRRAGGWLWLIAAGLLLLLAVSPSLLLDLLVLAGLGLLFLLRPDLSLPLVAASIPFWPRPLRILRWEFSLFEILLWLAVFALLARWVLALLRSTFKRSNTMPPLLRHVGTFQRCTLTGLDWPVLALLAVGLLSALFANRTDVALREFRTVFLGGVLFYGLITRVPAPGGGRFSPWPLLNGLIAGASIVSIVALVQLATGQGRIDIEGVWRVRAFYGSPNNLALLLDRIIPIALAVAAFGGVAASDRGASPTAGAGQERTSGGHSERTDSPSSAAASDSEESRVALAALRWLYALAALVMAAACAATFSKGALLLGLPIGIGLVLVIGAWRTRRRWPLGLLAGLLVAAAAGLAVLAGTPRFAGVWNFSSGTSFYRLRLWQGAWRMALDHPWLGVGPDNFLYAYRTRYVLPGAWQELNLSHPHNIALDLWTRLGVPGLLVGIWAIAAAARRAWTLLKHPDPWVWPIALGLLGGLAAAVAHGLIDNSLFLVDLMAVFMLTLGLLQRLTGETPD